MDFDHGAMSTECLLIAELKAPHKVNTGSRPDFIKIAHQMKSSFDKKIHDGVDNDDISMPGLLVEGFRCTFFVMDLKY
ncbi:hypothetical protein BDA99DRAFT_609132 [Phascolomyces articulosus]|uniref:Uncharacterized protein n=1 Tax=Phascolomyces articulosus TaxID=60185 RepID=A0AAD5JZ93_9FUNG|nr:hypothetical protein BDA99DRAFT_609132 [Phascolomyces articulosus]